MNSIRVSVCVLARSTRLCATQTHTHMHYSWLMHCLFAEQTNNHNKRIGTAIANSKKKIMLYSFVTIGNNNPQSCRSEGTY